MTGDGSPLSDAARRVIETDRPLVYLTFGTVSNKTPTFHAAVDALRSLEAIAAIVTVGPGGDVDAFGPVPDHVVITCYISQNDVFQDTAVVASHAGPGTLLGALSMGIAQVCLPQAADQFRNADACAIAGAGVTLKGDALTADAIAAAIMTALDNPTYRDAAATIAQEIETMPTAEDVAVDLERLVAKAQ